MVSTAKNAEAVTGEATVKTPAKPKGQTLEQKITQMVALHQLYFDPIDTPDQHLRCSFCEEALLIDYFQFGVQEMNRRLMSWVSKHSGCSPKLVTKTKDMVLTPKEKRAG